MPREIVQTPARQVCSLLGVECPSSLADQVFSGITTLESAAESDVAFVARAHFKSQVAESRAGLILVPKDAQVSDPRAVAVPNVWKSVLALLEHFHPMPAPAGIIHPTAIVPDSCTIGERVDIGAYAVLGEGVRVGTGSRIGAHAIIGEDTVIGSHAILHPRVTIADRCVVGDRVILHSGVVIGSDGFRYEVIDRMPTKIPQVGIVVIEDDVEIGANTTIDRASFWQTRIGTRTKIDNLVQVGHNCEIGSDCLIVSQVGIAGSVKIGRGVILAGQTGVGDNLTIGDGARLAARSGVHSNVPAGVDMAGAPIMDARLWMRLVGVLKRLPDLYDRLKPILREYEDRQLQSDDAVESASG